MAYWILKIVLTPILRVFFRVQTEGTENVPRRGPVILASNHQSFIDSVFLPLTVRRRVTFVAKAEYFQSWKTAWFFRAVGMIPLKRGGGSASERALLAAREVLEGGGVLGIYPEGTRSRDGRLYKGHTGVARLSLQTGAPVVPVAQFGTADVQPIGSMTVKLFKPVRVKLGRAIEAARTDGSAYHSPWPSVSPEGSAAEGGETFTPADLRRFTDEIMTEIAQLSGQERVFEYASRDQGRASAPGSEADPIPPGGQAMGASPGLFPAG